MLQMNLAKRSFRWIGFAILTIYEKFHRYIHGAGVDYGGVDEEARSRA